MEAAREAVRLVSLAHQSELPGVFGVLGAHVLDVNLERGELDVEVSIEHQNAQTRTHKLQLLTNLARFETKFDLHLAGLSTDPHVHLRGNKDEAQKK